MSLEYQIDLSNEKIDCIIGAYRDEKGCPFVLPSVRAAEEILRRQNLDHEYLPQDGLAEFNMMAQTLMFGEHSCLRKEGRLHTMQSISGTGALRLAFDFIFKFKPDCNFIIPNITWNNHPAMLTAAGIRFTTYRYLDSSRCFLAFEDMIEDIRNCPSGSFVLLHVCAHNPSGVDPTTDQWRILLNLFMERKLYPVFDNAYQGLASGNPNTDAFPVRLFADAGLEMIVACSFSKNFGLYGERVGALHVITASPTSIPAIQSQLRVISRVIYSTCPQYGARIVATILSNPELRYQWEQECGQMGERLISVRSRLHSALISHNVPGNWNHILLQRGMFTYSGLSRDIALRLKTDYHIYILEDGRISLSGLNASNIDYFVHSVSNLLQH